MVPIARKNLLADRTRLAISVGGVALSVLLVVILWGLYKGFGQMVTSYIDSIGADVWVTQKGSADMFHSPSTLPVGIGDRLAEMPEVALVHRHVGRQVKTQWKGRDVVVYAVGYRPEDKVGGPIRMVSGKSPPEDGEIIIDRVFAGSNSIGIGDTLDLAGQPFEVVGISEGGNMMLYQYSFITLRDAEQALGMKGIANFFAVRLTDPAQRDQFIQKLEEQISGVQGVPLEKFIENNRETVDKTFLPIIVVLVVIGFAVGVAVVGLTIYTATIERSREYGILKALGASNGQLYRIVFEQSLISALLGYLVGIALTGPMAWVAGNLAPSFVTYITAVDLAAALGLSLLMSLLASYIPVRSLLSVDPALVFRA